MARQAALLRGINVGGHNRVRMADLREMMEGLGYGEVRTHLQSGNVVYSTDESAETAGRRIEEGLAERLGGAIRVFTRTRDELAEIIAANPLVEIATDPSRLVVAFLSDKPDPTLLAEVDPAQYEPERFHVNGREIYLWYPNGQYHAKLGHPFLEKRLRLSATARNWNTVTRLLALADA